MVVAPTYKRSPDTSLQFLSLPSHCLPVRKLDACVAAIGENKFLPVALGLEAWAHLVWPHDNENAVRNDDVDANLALLGLL